MKPNDTKSKAGPQVEPSVEAGEKVGAYAFVQKVGRLSHPEDEGYFYPDDDDVERETLNGLIADAREIMAATPAAPSEKPRPLERGELADAVKVLTRHLPDLDAAAIPTKSEVFVVCGREAAEMRDAIKALATQAQGEPVAWRVATPSNGWSYYNRRERPMMFRGDHWTVQPLYAHPVQESREEAERLRIATDALRSIAGQGTSGSYPISLSEAVVKASKALAALQDTTQASSEAGQ